MLYAIFYLARLAIMGLTVAVPHERGVSKSMCSEDIQTAPFSSSLSPSNGLVR